MSRLRVRGGDVRLTEGGFGLRPARFVFSVLSARVTGRFVADIDRYYGGFSTSKRLRSITDAA